LTGGKPQPPVKKDFDFDFTNPLPTQQPKPSGTLGPAVNKNTTPPNNTPSTGTNQGEKRDLLKNLFGAGFKKP
jgi:hypothetical protein